MNEILNLGILGAVILFSMFLYVGANIIRMAAALTINKYSVIQGLGIFFWIVGFVSVLFAPVMFFGIIFKSIFAGLLITITIMGIVYSVAYMKAKQNG
jgi:hypothetical protein